MIIVKNENEKIN